MGLITFIAITVAIAVGVFVQKRIFEKHGLDGLEYTASLSSREVCTGDDVYLYEEIRNTGRLPMPYVKIETELPKGLEFTLLESAVAGKENKMLPVTGKRVKENTGRSTAKEQKSSGIRHVVRTDSIQSLFVLRPGSKITRRWRITCKKRGEYRLNSVLVTSSDLLGMHVNSLRTETKDTKGGTITVLPAPKDLAGHFASSKYLCGDAVSNLCPVTDPVRICGSREYLPSDPMNRINWKSTAVHGTLMTNIEEKTVRNRFSILLNMNSRSIETDPEVPSDTNAIERCIVVCTSVLDRIAAEDLPVRLYINTPPDSVVGMQQVADDETGAKIAAAGPFRGRRDMIYALRTMAKLEMKISVPPEKLFDHIAAHPELYSENENLIVISAYIDGRMLNLQKVLEPRGVHIAFYIATTKNDVGVIPDDADVYFSL